jgi:16S rRNA (guanine1207-N2)-methyltransferase
VTGWRADPAAAARALILRALEHMTLERRVLLAYEAGDALAAHLARYGIDRAAWVRRVEEDSARGDARCWPPAGPFDCVLLRLPRAKDEQEMAIHAALSVLVPSGKLVVYGGNDEGIRSAAGMLARVCGMAETLSARGHGRVLAATAPHDRTAIKGTLAAWRRTLRAPIAGVPSTLVTYPGVFASGGIDAATALLVATMPALPEGARVLDFGCGSGLIGANALAMAAARNARLALDVLDNDALALAAARENVPLARPILACALSDAARGYAAIFSNPPLHRGIAEDHRVLTGLIARAPDHLAPAGVLQIVVQRRVDVRPLLRRSFTDVAVVAESPRFLVWRAQAPRR